MTHGWVKQTIAGKDWSCDHRKCAIISDAQRTKHTSKQHPTYLWFYVINASESDTKDLLKLQFCVLFNHSGFLASHCKVLPIPLLITSLKEHIAGNLNQGIPFCYKQEHPSICAEYGVCSSFTNLFTCMPVNHTRVVNPSLKLVNQYANNLQVYSSTPVTEDRKCVYLGLERSWHCCLDVKHDLNVAWKGAHAHYV